MTILNLKHRIPEPEVMEGEDEVKGFMSSHIKKRRGDGGTYRIVSTEILRHTKFNAGRVLDIGCGYDGLLEQLHISNPKAEYYGIDLSKSMITAAKVFFSNATYKVCNAEKTEFDDEYFDLVVCRDTFHHFKNPMKVLKEAIRVTKKGGYIYIIDLRRDTPDDFVLQCIQEVAEHNIYNAMQYYDSMHASYTIPEIKKLFSKAGIKKYSIWKPSLAKDFSKTYKIEDKFYFVARNYLSDRWMAVIRK